MTRDYRGYTGTLAERFWFKVEIGAPDECWPFKAPYCRARQCYGSFQGRQAHRTAYSLAYLKGEPIPNGVLVCHSCDNRPCCNPAHLFLGTHKENMKDRNTKSRQARGEAITKTRRAAAAERNGMNTHPEKRPHGSTHGMAKVTEEEVREIRRLSSVEGLSVNEIGRRYAVWGTTIKQIVERNTWKHVE